MFVGRMIKRRMKDDAEGGSGSDWFVEVKVECVSSRTPLDVLDSHDEVTKIGRPVPEGYSLDFCPNYVVSR